MRDFGPESVFEWDDHGPGDGRGRFGPRNGPRRRMFGQGELQQLMLALIVAAPRHGYDLIREIEAMTEGSYAPSPGVVYPALSYMEDEGLIAADKGEDGSRKTYSATEEGRARAADEAERVAMVRQRLESLGADRERIDPTPVRRAMRNLKMAVVGRLSEGKANREFVLSLAEIIDDAARKIERSEP